MAKPKSRWKFDKNGVPYYHELESDIQKTVEQRLLLARIPFISNVHYRCHKCGCINNSHLSGIPDISIIKSGIELKTKQGKLRESQKLFQLKWPLLNIHVPKGREEISKTLYLVERNYYGG